MPKHSILLFPSEFVTTSGGMQRRTFNKTFFLILYFTRLLAKEGNVFISLSIGILFFNHLNFQREPIFLLTNSSTLINFMRIEIIIIFLSISISSQQILSTLFDIILNKYDVINAKNSNYLVRSFRFHNIVYQMDNKSVICYLYVCNINLCIISLM